MALNEHNASVLGRFHRALLPCRWEKTLIVTASGFATDDHIKVGGNGPFDTLYRTHLRRVRGKASPRECDEEFHRLVTGGHSDGSKPESKATDREDAREGAGSDEDA